MLSCLLVFFIEYSREKHFEVFNKEPNYEIQKVRRLCLKTVLTLAPAASLVSKLMGSPPCFVFFVPRPHPDPVEHFKIKWDPVSLVHVICPL